MSINQITTSNTFGQLITATAALIAVANNFTDGPQSQTGSTWTFTNANVGVNVIGTLLSTTANVGILNVSDANVTNETVSRSNVSTANITVANIVGATITTLNGTQVTTVNANVSGLLQVSDRANVFSANIQSANITTLAVTILSATELTIPVLNASFANITTLSVTGTSQHNALVATLVTSTNANVGILNASSVNVSNSFFATLNASSANLTTATVGTLVITTQTTGTATVDILNASFANITSANIVSQNTSSLNVSNSFFATLNASSANLTVGVMGGNPTTNLGIATKNYADTGAGGNLVNKLSFNAKGDIVLGTGANTYATLNTGTNGQVLIVDTNQTTGMRYSDRASQLFRGLVMGTSLADKSANGTQLVIYQLGEAIMDDGEVVRNWSTPTSVDISSNGAPGFLDTGVVVANTWYEVYAIRNSSTGAKNFLIHRAKDRKPDQNTMNVVVYPTGSALQSLGANNSSNLYLKLGQSFTPNVAGPLTSIEIRAVKTGATTNGNVWLTVEANVAGVPSGTTLATSRKMDIVRLPITTASNLRFIFDTTANVALATSYFWIFNTDYPASTTLFANLVYSLANTDIGANGVNRGLPVGNTGSAWVQLTSIGTFIYKTYVEANSTAVAMPTGYDQKCLISYAAVDGNTRFKEYVQQDRTIQTYYTAQWAGPVIFQVGTTEVSDLLLVVPPVTCFVNTMVTPGGSPLVYAIGRFHALDIPAVSTITEGPYGGGYTYGQGGSGTSFVASPFWVEHQAVLVRVQTASTKIYPVTITF